MFRRGFSFELYTCNLNISKTWFVMGSSRFLLLLQNPDKTVRGVSAGRIKLFSKKELLTAAKGKS